MGRHERLTSELQRGVLYPLLQALHGPHQLLVEFLDDLVQQAGVLESSPEGKRVVWGGRTDSERRGPWDPTMGFTHRRIWPPSIAPSSTRTPRPLPRRSPHHSKDAAPPMAVVQSLGSSQVSMVMVAGEPFTAARMEVGESLWPAPPALPPAWTPAWVSFWL